MNLEVKLSVTLNALNKFSSENLSEIEFDELPLPIRQWASSEISRPNKVTVIKLAATKKMYNLYYEDIMLNNAKTMDLAKCGGAIMFMQGNIVVFFETI